MRDLLYDAPHRRCIRSLDRLVKLGDTETPDDRLLLLRVTDGAAIVLDLDVPAIRVFRFLCHDLYN